MKVCPHCTREYPDSMTLCSADAAVLQSSAKAASAGSRDEEATLVRPRPGPNLGQPTVQTQAPQPYPLRPGRILAATFAALIVIFAVVWAFNRNSGSGQNAQGGPQLTVDPNSQPVQPATPPTGGAEQGILPNSDVGVAGGSTNANANANAPQGREQPTPANAEENANANSRKEKPPEETKTPHELLTPKPAPSAAPNVDEAPTPGPSPRPKPSAKPSESQPPAQKPTPSSLSVGPGR